MPNSICTKNTCVHSRVHVHSSFSLQLNNRRTIACSSHRFALCGSGAAAAAAAGLLCLRMDVLTVRRRRSGEEGEEETL